MERTEFRPGQRVRIYSYHPKVGTRQGTGKVIQYHRNGYWIILEDPYGTTCEYATHELTALDEDPGKER